MNIFGLEIERKTDVLALTAFLISVLTAVYQLGIFVLGPRATLMQPSTLMLYRFGSDNESSYLSAVASMSIANTSNASEPLLVRMETATLTVGKRRVVLHWHGQPDSPIAVGASKFEAIKAIGPFIVDTKKIQSSLVIFAPQTTACGADTACDVNQNYVAWRAFLGEVRSLIHTDTPTLTIELTAEFSNHKTVTAACTIPIHADQLRLLSTVGHVTERCQG